LLSKLITHDDGKLSKLVKQLRDPSIQTQTYHSRDACITSTIGVTYNELFTYIQ